MPRILADTNVLISALISPHGSPALLLERLRDGAFELIVSPKLLNELLGVLTRRKFRSYVTPLEARRYVVWLRHVGLLIPDPDVASVSTPDPADDFLVAVARAGKATAIVSGDRHLTKLPELDPPVFTPGAALRRLS